MDLREDIERDLITEPIDRFEIEDALRPGRRAVRRRRAATVLAGVAVAVVTVSGLSATLEDRPGTDSSVASAGTDSSCATPSAGRTPARCEGYQLLLDDPVAYTPSGRLVIRDGWTYTERLVDPLVGVRAAAVEVTDGTTTDWALLKEPDGNGDLFAEHADPADLPRGLTFTTWVSYAASRWQGTPATLLVTHTRSGPIEALPGWNIRRQSTGLTMPSGYRGPDGIDAVMQLGDPAGTWYLVKPGKDLALAFPLFGRFASVADVLDYVSSPAYDPERQGFLAGAR